MVVVRLKRNNFFAFKLLFKKLLAKQCGIQQINGVPGLKLLMSRECKKQKLSS